MVQTRALSSQFYKHMNEPLFDLTQWHFYILHWKQLHYEQKVRVLKKLRLLYEQDLYLRHTLEGDWESVLVSDDDNELWNLYYLAYSG